MTISSDDGYSLIFLSCDLTGSTQFKQRQGNSQTESPWQKIFLQFYREFPQELGFTQVLMKTQRLNFQLWKAVGDELLFTCRVYDEADVCDAVRTWIKTMESYREKSLDDSGLGTKGGAFMATFPGPDSVASIPRHPTVERSGGDVINLNRKAIERMNDLHHDYLFDFFGPNIDTGFRVLSQCSPRFFTVSVAVAFAMSTAHELRKTQRTEHDFTDLTLRPVVEMKGVWQGNRYPLMALDLEYNSPLNKAYRSLESTSEEKDKVGFINQLCRACSEDPTGPFHAYLPRAHEQLFRTAPTDPLSSFLTESTDGSESLAEDLPSGNELPEDSPTGK